MAQSDLERSFEYYAKMLGLPAWESEFRFHPTRKWRLDFARPDEKVGVECEGAVFQQGRHTRGAGFEKDCEKYNSAAAMGWVILRYTDGMLKKDPQGCIDQIKRVLDMRRGQ